MGYGNDFLLTFVPLFVAMDTIGNVPFVLAVLRGATPTERLRIINIALATALALGLAFLFLGRALLHLLDIEVGHLSIAGGLILLAISIRELTTTTIKAEQPPDRRELLAFVPIGTPFVAGPATLTSLLILGQQYGAAVVLPAYLSNIGIAWLAFMGAERVLTFFGQSGLQVLSKIAYLILTAIAVRMIVTGIQLVFNL